MYAIYSEGALLALSDSPRYVKTNEATGVYIQSDRKDAIALSINGVLYNIDGKNAIPDSPEVIIVEKEAAEYVFHNQMKIVENEEKTNIAIVEVENALCDFDMASEQKLIAMEEALCELDTIISKEVIQ